MIDKAKYVSDEIISELPNWLIHFLWYLLEECTQADPSFDGCFSLRHAPEGQRISCTVNGQLYAVNMPCPHAADSQVQIVPADNRLVMQIMRQGEA